jgi:hypothetical protein
VYLECDDPNPDGAHFASRVFVVLVADFASRNAKATLLLIGLDTISGQQPIMRLLKTGCMMMSRLKLRQNF